MKKYFRTWKSKLITLQDGEKAEDGMPKSSKGLKGECYLWGPTNEKIMGIKERMMTLAHSQPVAWVVELGLLCVWGNAIDAVSTVTTNRDEERVERVRMNDLLPCALLCQ